MRRGGAWAAGEGVLRPWSPRTQRQEKQAVAEAVTAWTPEQARHNHRMALQRLDWRHSLKRIAQAMSVATPALDEELARIDSLTRGADI